MGGIQRIPTTFTGILVGDASGQDSVYVDTHFIVSGLHYGNRLMGTIILDSIVYHTGSFGIQDSVTMALKSFYGDQWVTIDSVKKDMLTAVTTCTLFVLDGRDYLYGDMIALVIRVADTVGIATDDTVTYTVRVNLLHAWQD